MSIHRVTFTGTHYGSITCQNVVCFENPDGVMTDAAMATELRDNWCTILAAGQTSQFGWRSISIKKVDDPAAPYVLPVVVNGADLSDASAAVPAVSQKFRLLTSIGGRAGRGRIYVPGFRQAYWQAGQITATGITNMTVRINALKARYVGAGAASDLWLVLLGRDKPAIDRLQVTDIVLSSTPGIQRRRNLFVGI